MFIFLIVCKAYDGALCLCVVDGMVCHGDFAFVDFVEEGVSVFGLWGEGLWAG